MATVKITDLPAISIINANTANTVLVGVDIPTNITGKITLTTLAAGLYSNNQLVVGNNSLVLPNAVGQFTGNSATYVQVTLENEISAGSGDYVVTADDGTDTDHYIDMGINGSTYSDPTYSALKAHDGYLYVASSGVGKGNLTIGSTNSTGRVNFAVGGLETGNIVGYVDSSGIWSPAINSVVTANATSANSVINTRISANVATLRGEITGNTDSTLLAINSRITSNIFTANLFTQAAFNTANAALANTNGVYTAGDFYISGDSFVNGTMVVANSTFGATEAAMTITGTGTVHQTSQSGTMMKISGKANTPTRVIIDSFSTDGSAYGLIAGRSARGTAVSPAATQNNDVIMRIAGNGFGTTGFAPLGVARIDIVASENYTDTARGSRINFYNTQNGTNTVSEIASFNADSVTFTGVVNPAKGFIFTPRILTGAQTAITIDFAADSTIRGTFNSTLTIGFSNYTYGKVVEVWMTNIAGNGQTINLGALANNSTTGSTTLSVASGRSAKLQYFSIDGDLANVFCAITYA